MKTLHPSAHVTSLFLFFLHLVHRTRCRSHFLLEEVVVDEPIAHPPHLSHESTSANFILTGAKFFVKHLVNSHESEYIFSFEDRLFLSLRFTKLSPVTA